MTKITKVECDSNLKFCKEDSPCKLKAVSRSAVFINVHCNLLQDHPNLSLNIIIWSKNSKNIYSVLFNSTEDYCKVVNIQHTSMVKMVLDIFDHYLPGAAQKCPVKVI